MKLFQATFALLIAVTLGSSSALGFDWHPVADVEIPESAAVDAPKLRRMQFTTEESSGATETAASAAATSGSASAASSTPETEVPTTIMVLLPDVLAPTGSGSTMFFDGSVGADDNRKFAGSGSATDEASAAISEHDFGLATLLTAFTTLLVLTMM
ncbi:hypothetical protein PHYBOEH_008847 [Phytophthora boehmeriae]|uniref:Uncharacterized protein n=1 Tax=Phytophthora boehmeriae TaxID=109152 RepID=A0A8T1X0U9_9STRA|nr:hypothetical protein PHYBOEH_008847 [Phytophthora boehmeriae]